MEEIWKDAPGYEGLYKVPNYGRVMRGGVCLKPDVTPEGYCRVKLCKNGVGKRYLIHRLVAIVFLPNPNNYPLVNHKDLNPMNNHADNLEWCDYSYNNTYDSAYDKRVKTRRENGTYAVSEETKEKLRRFNLGKHSGNSMKVSQFTINGEYIATFVSMRDASIKTGVCHSSITQVCKGDRQTAGGYIWRYAS